jgi:cytochrome c oxidase assembly protein subunit 15
MVIIGGTTRLTGSGLSITEWKPIMGILPPMNGEHWDEALQKYRATPQFRISNPDITLDEFKVIFFWEYIHRLWGRLIGLLFALPLIYFTLTRQLTRSLAAKLFLILILGGAQGFLGWFMVMSGLVDRPSVSPYRLTAHLLLALALFSAVLWLACDQLCREIKLKHKPASWLKIALPALLVLLCLQIAWGGFMAGGKMAMSYPSFPDFNGQWLPSGLFQFNSFWRHICEQAAAVHLIHRTLGTLLVLGILVLWWKTRHYAWTGLLGWARQALVVCVIVQFLLGVMTVLQSIGHIPIFWGVAHQGTAVALLGSFLILWHQIATAAAQK